MKGEIEPLKILNRSPEVLSPDQLSTPSDLERTLEGICRSGERVYVAIFLISQPFDQIYERLQSKWARNRGITCPRKTDSVLQLFLHYKGRTRSLMCKGFLVKSEVDNVVLVVSYESIDSFKRLTKIVHDHSQPLLTRTYLRTNDFIMSIDALRNTYDNLTPRLVAYSSKTRNDDPVAKKKYDTARNWIDRDTEYFFEEITNNNILLTSITLSISDNYRTHVTMNRDATFCCEGNYIHFNKTLQPFIIRRLLERNRQYANVSASTSPTKKPIPIHLDFNKYNLLEKSELLNLRKVMSKYSDAAVSILHPNPYFHASVLDFRDGSRFDFWIAMEKSAIIVPGEKTTSNAIERFSNYLSESFHEVI